MPLPALADRQRMVSIQRATPMRSCLDSFRCFFLTAFLLASCSAPPVATAGNVYIAFVQSGLEVVDAHSLGEGDDSPNPHLCGGAIFYLPSVCPECAGRILECPDSFSLQSVAAYYSGYSWLAIRDQVLVQFDSRLPEDAFLLYVQAIPGFGPISTLMPLPSLEVIETPTLFLPTPSATFLSTTPIHTPSATSTPVVALTDTATPVVAFTNTPAPLPGFILVDYSASVSRNHYAHASIRTLPGSSCQIQYFTPSGAASTAQGLDTKTADDEGICSWSWLIGGNTTPGTGRIRILANDMTQDYLIEINP